MRRKQQFRDRSRITIDRTTIAIAHRLSVRNADCIYVMEQGKLVEWGQHEQLLEQQVLCQPLASAVRFEILALHGSSCSN